MIALHPQYLKDADGEEKFVVLATKEFEELLEEIEGYQSVKIYDEAKNEDDGTRISFQDYMKNRNSKNA